MQLRTLSIVLLTGFATCTQDPEKETSTPVAGVFVKQGKGEFSKASDTLIIRAVEGQRHVYSITRRVGFQRLTEKGLAPKEFRQEASIGLWEKEGRQLKEQKHGRLYLLAAGGDSLILGLDPYYRIK